MNDREFMTAFVTGSCRAYVSVNRADGRLSGFVKLEDGSAVPVWRDRAILERLVVEIASEDLTVADVSSMTCLSYCDEGRR